MDPLRKEKSCGALVYRIKNGELELLLLKHRFGGHWSFPKGHVEEGETEVETALREVHEETGLTIQLEDGSARVWNTIPDPIFANRWYIFLDMPTMTVPGVRKKKSVRSGGAAEKCPSGSYLPK